MYMDSSKGELISHQQNILNPFTLFECKTFSEPRSNYCVHGRIQPVFVSDPIRGGALYIPTECGGAKLFFCLTSKKVNNWHGQKLPCKGLTCYALVEYRSELVLVGGQLVDDDNHRKPCSTNKIWSLNSKENKWKELPPMFYRRFYPVAVSSNDHLAVIGGYNEVTECLTTVEVYNGVSWTTVEALPQPFPYELLSAVVCDGNVYVMESVRNSSREGATNCGCKISVESLISGKSWQSVDSLSCRMFSERLPPISFCNQVIAVGKKPQYAAEMKFFLYSQKPNGKFVDIQNVPVSDSINIDNIVCIATVSSTELLLIYKNGKVMKGTLTETAKDLDSLFSVVALNKLDLLYSIDLLSQLTPLTLIKLKDKALFHLKIDRLKVSSLIDLPAVNVYLQSWLLDQETSCPPTWRNLLTVLNSIGLNEVAEDILKALFHGQGIDQLTIQGGSCIERLVGLHCDLACLNIGGNLIETCCEVSWRMKRELVITDYLKARSAKLKLKESKIEELSDKQSKPKRPREEEQCVATTSSKKPRKEASSSSECTRTSPEERNFFKLCRIMMIVIAEELRELFKKLYKSKEKKDWQNSHGQSLLSDLKKSKKTNLFPKQEQLIQSGNIDEWDLSLLFLVLLLGNRNNFWRLQQVKCDALKNLRDVRNNSIGHNSDSSLSTKQLEDEVKKIVIAVETLLKSDNKNKERVISAVKKSQGDDIADTEVSDLRAQFVEMRQVVYEHEERLKRLESKK